MYEIPLDKHGQSSGYFKNNKKKRDKLFYAKAQN